ncbi:MAG TPA: helix-turn-helix domain-containing protein [Planctomycetota bacterium]|nr:helix-turn-helix domain-containing protein [Planctomycetota bacterium]
MSNRRLTLDFGPIYHVRIATDHRDSILQTAARLFARKPYHEVLMDEVAEQIGIAKGTIYRYFPNKEELFAALHLQFLDTLITEVRKAGPAGDPLANIRAKIVRSAQLVSENHDFFQVMLRHECEVWALKNEESLQRRNVLRDLYSEQIAVAEANGLVACQYGPEVAANMLFGMMRNIWRFTDPTPDPVMIGEMVMQMFLYGVSTDSKFKMQN